MCQKGSSLLPFMTSEAVGLSRTLAINTNDSVGLSSTINLLPSQRLSH